MKNKKYLKRLTSSLLTIVMMITTFVSTGIQAFAIGERISVYIVEYPRAGDANYKANWGNGQLYFKNGWSMQPLKKIFTRAIGSYNGQICYCIEPGNSQISGDSFISRDESFWDNLPGNDVLSADEIKTYIGRIMQYGYKGNLSTSWMSQNESNKISLSHSVATQFLIWETIVGERDSSFNKVSTGGANAIWDMMSPSNPIYTTTLAIYDSMVRDIQNHTKVPSFCTRSTGSANEIELEWNGTEYIATLTDSNGVLGNYTYTANVSGFDFSTSDNVLTIKTKIPPTDTVIISATKNNSYRKGIITWTDGRFQPGSGKQDIVTYGQSVSDPVKGFVKVKVSLGSANIVKSSEDGIVEGLSFIVEGENFKQTVQTNSNGVIQIDNLVPGVYTVTEQNYEKYEPQQSQKVTVVSGQVSTVNFSNKLRKGSLIVTKTSEDNFVEGVKFHLYGTSLGNTVVDEYAVTDSTGVAKFENIPIGSDFTLEEVDTDIKYVVPDKQQVTINWNEVTQKTVHNALKKFNVVVTKSDAETVSPQGNGTLSGAVYGIYKGETLVDKYTTDEKGQFVTSYYVCDNDWTIREITPSEGYLLDTTIHKVGAEPELYQLEYNTAANDVTEKVIKGNISIIKHADNGDTQIETPEPNAQFEIYLKSAGSYDDAKDSEKDLLITDENGFAQSKNMPYGIYTVHQIVGLEGHELMADFDVYISQDGETYRYIINNSVFESFIKIVKNDAETGKTIPYVGSAFQIFDPTGKKVEMTVTYPEIIIIDTFYTNAEGYLVTPEKLEYGKGYSLVEVQAPYGYVINKEPVYFDVTADDSTSDNGVVVIEVVKNNIPQKGVISITKTGEIFSTVTESNGVYNPVYEVSYLEGAVYQIIAKEDIVTPEGTVRLKAGEVADTITTGNNGIAKSKELYLGKYQIKEITAPNGMTVNTNIQNIELVYAGQEIEITQSDTGYYNERQKAEISLYKSMEKDDKYGTGLNDEIKDVTFGIYANKDIIAKDKSKIPLDGLIEIISLDDSGKGVFTVDLPFGEYYVKEVSTNSSYIISDEKYPVNFEYLGQETDKVEIVVNRNQIIENKIYYGEISGLKTDQDDKPLTGAVIGIFKQNDIEFTKENALEICVTNEKGEFEFKNITCGEWYIREIEAPNGYTVNDTVYTVVISQNQKEEIKYDAIIKNKLIIGNVELTKVDEEYPDNHLSGAKFELYKDSNNNFEFDKNDELIGKLEELSDGVYRYNNLTFGGYFVKETKAPIGFILDENAYYFEIKKDGATVNVETEAGIGFINKAQKGSIKVVKSSDDNKLEGFRFKVEGTDITGGTYYNEFVTDSNGCIDIKDLRYGSYTITEMETETSSKYILPDSKTVEIKDMYPVIVTFHNKLKPTIPDIPDTGDRTNTRFWAVISALALIGAIATGFVICKKNSQ